MSAQAAATLAELSDAFANAIYLIGETLDTGERDPAAMLSMLGDIAEIAEQAVEAGKHVLAGTA